MNNNISASELADRLEMGETIGNKKSKVIFNKTRYGSNLERDIAAMEYRHTFEEMMVDQENSYMHPNCMFRNYDWNSMYEEDSRCEDKGYISNLKSNLGKSCTCPNHEHIKDTD